MNFKEYCLLLEDENVSDDDVYKALLELTDDNAPSIPENANGELNRVTKQHRPEVSIRFHALVLELFVRSDDDRTSLAKEMNLPNTASYLEIARAIKESE